MLICDVQIFTLIIISLINIRNICMKHVVDPRLISSFLSVVGCIIKPPDVTMVVQ